MGRPWPLNCSSIPAPGIPAVVKNHPDHRRVAAALTRAVQQGKRVVTTNLVIAETHALLLRRVNASVALAFARTVRLPPNLVVTSDPDLEAIALGDWLERFSDQEFSLTDAVSFAVMARRGIADALTLDRHFVVAGFRALPGVAA